MPRVRKNKNHEKPKGQELAVDIKQDRKEFISTFEKPTQIYRFLKSRHEISPVFLHRTLSYMSGRCSRTNARRKVFKMDQMLESCVSSNGFHNIDSNSRDLDEMKISIMGFYYDPGVDHDNSISIKCKAVDAEILIRKTQYKKRKGGRATSMFESIGRTSVWVNPRNPENYSQESFAVDLRDVQRRAGGLGGGADSFKNYTLVFRIYKPRNVAYNYDSDDDDDTDEDDDVTLNNSDDDDDESIAESTRGEEEMRFEKDDKSEISLRNLQSGVRKRKPTVNIDERMSATSVLKSDTPRGVQARKYRKVKLDSSSVSTTSRPESATDEVVFETEMAIFDTNGQPLLKTGDYEITMPKENSNPHIRSKNLSWESIGDGKEIGMLSSMNNAPLLRFKLDWSEPMSLGPLSKKSPPAPVSKMVTTNRNGDVITDMSLIGKPRPKRHIKLKHAAKPKHNDSDNNHDNSNSSATASLFTPASSTTNSSQTPPPPPIQQAADLVEYRKWHLNKSASNKKSSNNNSNNHQQQNGHANFTIYFQFMYNRDSQQQTEARTDYICPWCNINCINVYALVKHLKMCHPRFNFTLVNGQVDGNWVLEISLNECYDNSFSGNPHFIYALPGLAKGRRGPVKRVTSTETLVSKAGKAMGLILNNIDQLIDGLDGTEENNRISTNSHYASAGHKRLYFHSGTTLPIRPCEFDIDSEEESDPDWLRGYTERMIDDFTDVNEGEKELMKLWNLFSLKYNCTADCEMPRSCKKFIDVHHKDIAKLHLRGNLILHFVNMVDFGIINASIVLQLIQHYDSLTSSSSRSTARKLVLDGHHRPHEGNPLGRHQKTSTYQSEKLKELRRIIGAAETRGDIGLSP